MKLGLADAYRHVSDPDALDLPTAALLDPDYLSDRAAQIDMAHARQPSHGIPRHGGTVYLATADASGMMVSFIQSNYRGFGSGVVVPGTGISLQNRGSGSRSSGTTPTKWVAARGRSTRSSRAS